MRKVVIRLPYEELDAIRAFINYHTKGTNVLLREWLDKGCNKQKEEIEYVFEEV